MYSLSIQRRPARRPAHAVAKSPTARGPRSCFRSAHVAAPCSVCGAYSSPVHMPINGRKLFCPAHCPECNRLADHETHAESEGRGQ